MPNAVQTPADLANVALARMGYKLRVGSLLDGSMAAKKLLDIYAETRDELLRGSDWDFAEGNMVASLLKAAPVGGYIPPAVWDPSQNPPLPWKFSYTYPDDCVKVRAMKAAPIFVPNYDPQPTHFSIVNDNAYTPARRVIVTDVANAILVYTRRVIDPTTWDVGFTQSLAIEVMKSIGPALVGVESVKLPMSEEATDIPRTEVQHG